MPVAENTIAQEQQSQRDGFFWEVVLLFLVFLFIHTHELTAHTRFFCHATNVVMLLHDVRVGSSILKTRPLPPRVACAPCTTRSGTSGSGHPWLTSLFTKTKLNIGTIKTNRSTNRHLAAPAPALVESRAGRHQAAQLPSHQHLAVFLLRAAVPPSPPRALPGPVPATSTSFPPPRVVS
jgi:hypothetical protein